MGGETKVLITTYHTQKPIKLNPLTIEYGNYMYQAIINLKHNLEMLVKNHPYWKTFKPTKTVIYTSQSLYFVLAFKDMPTVVINISSKSELVITCNG